jgi:hypothetical protein
MSTTTKKASATAVKVVIEPGSILSETSFYVVKEVQQTKVIVYDDFGHEITLGTRYVEEICTSADHFTTEEKKSMTELAELFINSPRIAMTVSFITKATEKTKKDFEAEKKAKIDEIQNASMKTANALLNDLMENPITNVIPGKLRTMKGRHYGHVDDLGRVNFVDMEIKKDPTKDYDTRSRQVDPRTIQSLIINKVKYTLK